MNSIKLPTINPSRFAMPVPGHQCALGMSRHEAVIVRDRALTGVLGGFTVAYKGAFPGPDAWSPPI